MVDAGDELASLYSPDLLVTVQNLLDARRGQQSGPDQDRPGPPGAAGASARTRSPRSSRPARPTPTSRSRSPITGHVLKKYVKEGQYVDEGSPLYDVVDLTTVWIQAQVYEDDLAFLPRRQLPDQGSRRRSAKP